jgi:recombination protein RecR
VNKGLPVSLKKLIELFAKMPGIGVKSAERMAFYVLKSEKKDMEGLAGAIEDVKRDVQFCRICNNLADGDTCSVCSDSSRDRTKICVVEGPNGIIAMEKIHVYNGLYHVLLGDLSPIDGVGPEDLKIGDLIARIKKEGIKEVILATDFTTEGETTALYLIEAIKPYNIEVTRLARGVPVGASLEYADMATVQRAFEERR